MSNSSSIPAEIKQNMDRVVEYLYQNGLRQEDLLKQRHQQSPEYSFLFPGTPYHETYKMLVNNLQIQSGHQYRLPQDQMQVEAFAHKGQSHQQMHPERKSRWNEAPSLINTVNTAQNPNQTQHAGQPGVQYSQHNVQQQ